MIAPWTPLITPTIAATNADSHGYCVVIWPSTAYSASERPSSLCCRPVSYFTLRGDASSRRRMTSTTPSSSHPPSHYIAAALHPDPLLSPMQTSSPRLPFLAALDVLSAKNNGQCINAFRSDAHHPHLHPSSQLIVSSTLHSTIDIEKHMFERVACCGWGCNCKVLNMDC